MLQKHVQLHVHGGIPGRLKQRSEDIVNEGVETAPGPVDVVQPGHLGILTPEHACEICEVAWQRLQGAVDAQGTHI